MPDDLFYLQNEDHAFDRYPQWNDEKERMLFTALQSLLRANAKDVRAKIKELEADHARRRELIWAELGEAMYSELLQYLILIAELTATNLDAGDLSELEKRYSEHSWRADWAVLQLLGRIDSGEDLTLFGGILDMLYTPWLDASARYLQDSGIFSQLEKADLTHKLNHAEVALFVDGLRFDCAMILRDKFIAAGCVTEVKPRWTGLPTITATCKPILIEPILSTVSEKQSRDETNYVALNSYEFKKVLEKNNWKVLTTKDVIPLAERSAGKAQSRLWLEYGILDELGHSQGWSIARHVESTLAEIVARIKEIFQAGWEKVLILSDHGWLLSPNNLPKTDLSACLSESKWHRFATLKEGAQAQEHLFPWYWDPNRQIAIADGVSCYSAGVEYTHGGLSIQECLLLDIMICKTESEKNKETVKITDIKWTNMRCGVAIEGQGEGMVFDIRYEPGDLLSSVVLNVNPIRSDHSASVVVEDETLQGNRAYVVILDPDGNIVSQMPTIIGGGKDDSTG